MNIKSIIKSPLISLYASLCGKKQKLSRFQFEVHLTDACNLNCAGCSHFSPLAKNDSIYPLEDFKNDFEQLSKLINQDLEFIKLLGGEPLLNEHVIEYIQIARGFFPQTKIFIVSNGLLIKKMSDEFWNCCLKNHIIIAVTEYPVKIDYDEIIEYIKSKGCEFKIYSNRCGENSFRNISLNKKKPENYKKRFYNCWIGNHCTNCDIHLLAQEFSLALLLHIAISIIPILVRSLKLQIEIPFLSMIFQKNNYWNSAERQYHFAPIAILTNKRLHGEYRKNKNPNGMLMMDYKQMISQRI